MFSAAPVPAPPPPPAAPGAHPAPPPPGAPAAPPPPGPPPASSSNERSVLLGSIQGFSKAGLKKAVTVDKSVPKV